MSADVSCAYNLKQWGEERIPTHFSERTDVPRERPTRFDSGKAERQGAPDA